MAEATQTELDDVQAAMAERNFAGALRALDELLEQSPEHGDALYFKAVCLRYLQRFAEAGEVLDALLQSYPNNGRAYQELGHWYRDQGRTEDALTAYTQACQQNPALAAAFNARVQILRKLGRDGEAARVYNQLQHLQRLPN